MRESKNVLTTGEVAKICNVASRTVSKWFDSGKLPGYRIPGSKDRRIPLDQLVRFMRSNNIPLNGLDTGFTRVLVLDAEDGVGQAVRSTLTDKDGFEVATATSALEAGAHAARHRPHVFLVDVTLCDVSANAVMRFVRSLPDGAPVCVIGMASALSDSQGQALLQDGFQGYLSKPFESRTLTELIDSQLAVSATA